MYLFDTHLMKDVINFSPDILRDSIISLWNREPITGSNILGGALISPHKKITLRDLFFFLETGVGGTIETFGAPSKWVVKLGGRWNEWRSEWAVAAGGGTAPKTPVPEQIKRISSVVYAPNIPGEPADGGKVPWEYRWRDLLHLRVIWLHYCSQYQTHFDECTLWRVWLNALAK